MDIFSEIAVLQTQGCFNASDLVCLGMLAPQDIQGVSMAQMGLLISFWAFATLSDSLSFRLSEGYRQNSISKRKNTQTYLLELIVTPALLLYIIFTAPRIITLEQAGREGFSMAEAKTCGQCINIVVVMYVFEIIYRDEMNGWLAVHHVVTILWGCAASAMYYETLDLVRKIGKITRKQYFSKRRTRMKRKYSE